MGYSRSSSSFGPPGDGDSRRRLLSGRRMKGLIAPLLAIGLVVGGVPAFAAADDGPSDAAAAPAAAPPSADSPVADAPADEPPTAGPPAPGDAPAGVPAADPPTPEAPAADAPAADAPAADAPAADAPADPPVLDEPQKDAAPPSGDAEPPAPRAARSAVSGESPSVRADTVPSPSPSPSGGSARLTLKKVVVNDDGGAAVPADWTLQVSLDGESWQTLPQGVATPLPFGTYRLRETGGPTGYTMTDLTCDSYTWDPEAMTITLRDGDDNTCTFTNDDEHKKTALKLRKLVVNDDGGAATAEQWNLRERLGDADWVTLDQGEWTDVEPGTYELSEFGGPTGYALQNLSCDKEGSDASAQNPYVTLEAGDAVTCTFTNNDQRATVDLELVKTSSDIPERGVDYGEQFSWYLTVTNVGPGAATDAVVTDTIPAGVTVQDVIVPSGWVDASVGSDISVTVPSLEPGDSGVIEVVVTVDPLPTTEAPFLPPGSPTPTLTLPSDEFVNTACVKTPDDSNDDNDCDTNHVPRKILAANVWVSCINDAPFLMYQYAVSRSLQGLPVTLTWTPQTPAVPASKVVTLTTASGRIDWPGVTWDGNGLSIDWPGWRPLRSSDFGPDGLPLPGLDVYLNSVRDPSEPDEGWRQPTDVTISVNPHVTFNAIYPPATPQCTTDRTPRLADTGDDGGSADVLMTLAALSLFGGAVLFTWSRRRRSA